MSDIFISYKTEDRARVAPLVAALREAGLDVWWDQDIPAGGGWRHTIAEQLDIAKLCVVAWSGESTGPRGRFVLEEAERTAARNAARGRSARSRLSDRPAASRSRRPQAQAGR